MQDVQLKPATPGAPVQKREKEGGAPSPLKNQLRGQSFDEGAAALAPVQMKGGGGGTDDVHRAAAAGVKGGGGALPHGDSIQKAFGKHDVSGIQSHSGGEASAANKAMGASAYASGDHIAFDGAPDLHTAAHEAAHVIQQKGGVSLAGGVGQSGDRYEQHADQVADAVVQGKSAEPILDKMSGGGGGGGVQKKVVQREDKPKSDAKPTPDGQKPEGEKAAEGAVAAEAAKEPDKAPDWRDKIVANRDSLLASAAIDTVDNDTGKTVSFKDATLEAARLHYCATWGAPVTEIKASASTDAPAAQDAGGGGPSPAASPAGGEQAAAPAPKAPEAKPAAKPAAPKTSGDSEAGDVKSAPAWFNVFQNHCIESGEWSIDQKVTQILVSAYLRAANQGVAANVLAFFDHAGKSEKNSQAGDLSYGAGANIGKGDKATLMKETKMWCQQATSDAYVQGFRNCGYTFLSRTVSAQTAASIGYPLPQSARDEKGAPKAGAMVTIDVSGQPALAALMAKDIPKLVPPDPSDKAGKTQGSFYGAAQCWDATLESGDMVSFVTSKSSVSTTGGYAGGHAVTIVSCQNGGDARAFKFISGNAGSQTANNGSIRFEEGTWVKAPGNFSLNTTRPKNSGEMYIYSITKTSKLQPNYLDDVRKADPGKLGSDFKVAYDPKNDKRAAGGG